MKINNPPLTINHLKSALKNETLYIDIHGMNDYDKNSYVIHVIGLDFGYEENHVILSYQPQNALLHARSLFMNIQFESFYEDWMENRHLYPSIVYSPFIEPMIDQANQLHYELVEMNKETKEEKIISSNEETDFNSDSSFFENEFSHSYSLAYSQPLDFKQNEYKFKITFQKDGKVIFSDEAVIRQ